MACGAPVTDGSGPRGDRTAGSRERRGSQILTCGLPQPNAIQGRIALRTLALRDELQWRERCCRSCEIAVPGEQVQPGKRLGSWARNAMRRAATGARYHAAREQGA